MGLASILGQPALWSNPRWHQALFAIGSAGVALGLIGPGMGTNSPGGIGNQPTVSKIGLTALGDELANLAYPEFAPRRHEFLCACVLAKPTPLMRKRLRHMVEHALTALDSGNPTLACEVVEVHHRVGETTLDQALMDQLRTHPEWQRHQSEKLPLTSPHRKQGKTNDSTSSIDRLIPGARIAAQGELSDLVATHGTFVMVVESHTTNDPVLWQGIERLAAFALEHPDPQGARIARRIVGMFEYVDPPSHLTRTNVELQEFLYAWQARKR